jgi:hypothetical protein
MGHAIDAETLRGYLAETLPAEEMARVEKALRDSAELRAQLEDVRQNRGDAGLHTLGAIWRRGRLSCPSRRIWGSYLLEALDPAQAEYLTFHLDVIACPFCQANLADLEGRVTPRGTPASKTRQSRIFQSSRHLLSNDG